MIVTIMNGGEAGNRLILTSRDKRFVERYGEELLTTAQNFYLASVEISEWANNELKEECIFDID